MPLGKFGEGAGSLQAAARLESRVIAGGAAGNLTVTGIKQGDSLQMVQRVDAAGANLRDEFTVSANDTINNTAGTNTTGFILLIVWTAAERGQTGYGTGGF
jgi:hypothetical protein